MSIIAFVSAVSDEFHHKDPRQPRSFESYRDVLAHSLRILVRDSRVITQEDLAQGPADLLATLEQEIRISNVVVHLVGDMAGAVPEPASVRRLRDRHPEWLAHEPELRDAVGDGNGISYTQWEAYLAFQHGRGRLVFVMDDQAPRSPRYRNDEQERASQQEHLGRLRQTGEHYELCADQLDLARKAVASIERFGLRADAPASSEAALAAARQDAADISTAIGTSLRTAAKTASTDFDPAGIGAYLQAIDTAALQRELDRRAALQAVHEHRQELRARVAADPAAENLYELALGELALANYLEAMQVAERLAGEQVSLMQSDPDAAEEHRERALNALLLLHEAAQLARRRDDAIAALERAASFVDIKREPILWADVHEPLAEYLLEHAQYDRAEPFIDEIIDIREEQGEEDPALPRSLMLWCDVLNSRARFGDVVAVAARAARLLSTQDPPDPASLAAAIAWQATSLRALGRFAESEPLMRRALDINERTQGDSHPDVAICLNNLAQFLHTTNRPAEAEPLIRRSLTIMENSFGFEHPNVAIPLTNLAQVLQATNRLAEAEPLLRRALVVDEQYYGPEHPSVARDLSNLASLLHDENRLAEAEPLVRRALAIDEQSFGAEHPNVGGHLNNLAQLLLATNRPAESELLMRRALAIDESCYGCEHLRVAQGLKHLASLLRTTNRQLEAEPLMRRALAIEEQSYGTEHPNIAVQLNNLAVLLQDTNRLAEAEPLMRRPIKIFLKLTQATGQPHAQLNTALENYGRLLHNMGRSDAEIRQALQDLLEEYGMSLG